MQDMGVGNVSTEGAMMIFWSGNYQCLKSYDIYLWSKVVCSVLFITLRCPKPQSIIPHLISLESSSMSGVHQLGFSLELQYKLLIIEPFSQWKLYKIKTEFADVLGVVGMPLASWIIISQFSELRCKRYWFLLLEMQNFSLEGKISRALNVFALGANSTGYISVYESYRLLNRPLSFSSK
jgi:hypothetical protein